MGSAADDTPAIDRKSPEDLAQLLIRLFDERFGGASSGRFRISRKFLRYLAGRRKLPDAYLAKLAEEIFEAGFVFVDCESYSILLSQKQFASYRRVTSVAANKALTYGQTNGDPKSQFGEKSERSDLAEIEEKVVQRAPKIH